MEEIHLSNVAKVPDYGWKVPLNHQPKEKRDQRIITKFHQVLPLIGLGIRYLIYSLLRMWNGRRPLMDYLYMEEGKQIYGCPLGGIGGGTIGRGYRGEFCRFQMRPGMYSYNIVDADQFILTVQNSDDKVIFQQVLNPSKPPSNGKLSKWRWEMDPTCAKYTALYPRAWTEYDFTKQAGIKLICRQISPVIPHNYKDSSFPGAIFVWSVENTSDDIRVVNIALSFQNGIGDWKSDSKGGAWSRLISESTNSSIQGVAIHHDIQELDYCYILGGKQTPNVTISTLIDFNPSGDGGDLWTQLSKGKFKKSVDEQSAKKLKGQTLGAAINARTTVKPGDFSTIELCLAWDQPAIQFPDGKIQYIRYYTQFWRTPFELIEYGLTKYPEWENAIDSWQSTVLNDTLLPKWFKGALFNELYYIADGGSLWTIRDDDPTGSGRYAYLEGHEYRMYNTYDVHFYASTALAQLWPELQHSIQRDIAEAVGMEIPDRVWLMYKGGREARKKPGTVPHDLGDPDENPFVAINAYPIHDVSDWRDLNTKFVLQVYRDYVLNKDLDHLRAMWPVCKQVLEKTKSFDKDGDGLIESSGEPDQTYDSWVVEGASAYCGGLWLAALVAAVRIGEILKEPALVIEEYQKLLDKGRSAYHDKLWNGKYYKYDCSHGRNSTSIMSDQLCGHWYLRSCGLHYEVFPKENVITSLKTIFEYNVKKFGDGRLGAVNGMLPNGKPDPVTVQSEEAWTGVTYAIAALMLYEELDEEAWETAGGLSDTIWNQIGMGFETPEALLERPSYRSIGYMRPLSIWSMHHAWFSRKSV